MSEAACWAWDNGGPEGRWGLAVGALALSRALLTKALALDAAVGGGAVPGVAELEGSSEGVSPPLLTLACTMCQKIYLDGHSLRPAAALLLCGGTCGVAGVMGMDPKPVGLRIGCVWGAKHKDMPAVKQGSTSALLTIANASMCLLSLLS